VYQGWHLPLPLLLPPLLLLQAWELLLQLPAWPSALLDGCRT
jgi:hypothetical protein